MVVLYILKRNSSHPWNSLPGPSCIPPHCQPCTCLVDQHKYSKYIGKDTCLLLYKNFKCNITVCAWDRANLCYITPTSILPLRAHSFWSVQRVLGTHLFVIRFALMSVEYISSFCTSPYLNIWIGCWSVCMCRFDSYLRESVQDAWFGFLWVSIIPSLEFPLLTALAKQRETTKCQHSRHST